jgi:hypothetical protein
MEEAMQMGVGPNATASGLTPNPADPRNAYTTIQLGQTAGGRQAVLKMLHPCMEKCDTVTKVPDGAVSTSVVMERRDEFELSNQTTSTTNWNCIVITNPLLSATQSVIQYDISQTPSELQLWQAYSECVSTVPSSHAYPLWQTGDVGAFSYYYTNLVSTTLTPAIIADQTGAQLSALVKNIRRTYLGTTSELDASDLYNQGRLISGQWNPDLDMVTKEIKTGDVLTDVFDYYKMQAPAMTSASLVQSDEKCREAEAKTGSYMPLRPCAPTFELTASAQFRRVDINYPGAGDEPVDPATDAADLGLRGWSIAVELWLGIDVRANIRIKRREGLEIVPAPDSTYGPFATPALPCDLRAKQILEEFCRNQPHAYPADYNDLGEMIPNILGGIADVIGGLGLPLISPVANFAKGLLPKSQASVNSLVEQPQPLYQTMAPPADDMDKLVAVLKKLLSK